MIAPFTVQGPGLHGVPQQDVQNVIQAGLGVGGIDGTDDLHPALGVAGHHVRRTQEEALVLSRAKAVDAGVLQKAPHHAGDGDVLRVAGDAGPQAADAADDEIDPNPCTRGLGQLFHDIVVGEGVHLHDDAAVAAPGGLFPDEQEDDLLQVGGGDQEVVVAALQIAHSHVFEKFRCILADALICGDEGEVCVLL